MQQLSLFRGVHDTQPRPVTLEELVTMMRSDQSVRDLTDKHRYARSMDDALNAGRYKKMMASFGVAARFEGGRQQKHIVELTGLSLVDIDHIAPDQMSTVLEKVRADEHTLLAYTTLSGQGLRVIARFVLNEDGNTKHYTLNAQQKDNDDGVEVNSSKSSSSLSFSLYKTAFLQINEYYAQLTGLPTDGQCKNVGRISTIAYDENLYYNPDAVPFVIKEEKKKPVGRPRRVESGKMKDESGKMKVERCEATVLRELKQRGVVYGPGTHNRYISDACYMMNRYGVSEEECTTWAVGRFSDYQAEGNDVPSIVHSCYQQTEEHGKMRLPHEGRDKQATVAQIEAFLAEHVHLRRNVVTGFVEILSLNEDDDENENVTPSASLVPLKEGQCSKHYTLKVCASERDVNPFTITPRAQPKLNNEVVNSKQKQYRQFTDNDRNSLWRALSKELGLRVVRQDISAVVKSDFSPRYHPFEEYINSLQPWDGETDHIARLASSVTVKGDQDYFVRCFKKWLVAFIAAIFDPEEVNHEILVFIGRQGSYKSTWFHYLLPPKLRQYFLPKLMSNSGITKDDLFKIAQSGLVCLEEIDNMKQRDLNQLKAITTMRTINERRSYGEFNEFHRHIASFCATGNNRFFLTDHTGNRRFLTFEVESIVPPQTYDFSYEKVYAQAYALWQQGFRYWFNEEENAEINLRNTEFEAPNKEWELINKYYRRPLQSEECKFLTATDILERINSSIKEQLSTVRIGIALRAMGIERVRSGNSRGYRLVEITPDQININQKALGNFTESIE